MKHSKLFTSLVLAGLGVFSLASCGSSSDNTITFYTSAGTSLSPLLEAVAEEFNSTHDDYQVDVTVISGGYDGVKEAVIADLATGNLPDLAYCYPDHVAEYLEANVVVDLSEFILDDEIGYTDEEIADFIEGYWAEGYEAFGGSSIEDGMYTVPFSKSTEVMYYNIDALEDLVERGVLDQETVDDIDNWTWETFWDVCSKIKNSVYSEWVPMGYDSVDNWMITLCEQYGYDYTSSESPYYLFNNDDVAGLLTTLKEYFDQGLYTVQDIYGSYTSNLFTVSRQTTNSSASDYVYTIESCVFSIGSSAGASYQDSDDFEVGVTSIPQVDPTNPKSINQGPSLVMLDQGDDDKERATWEFVKMLLEPEFQAEFSAQSGYIPVRLSAQDVTSVTIEDSEGVAVPYSEWLSSSDDLIAQTINFALENYDMYFVSPAFSGSNTARTQIGYALVYVLNGTDPKDALQDAYDECTF